MANTIRVRGGGKKSGRKGTSLTVRLDMRSKRLITKAADLRKISPGDYVRAVVIGQAAREVEEAAQNVVALTPAEQLAFWNALHEPVQLTDAQRELGRLMQSLK